MKKLIDKVTTFTRSKTDEAMLLLRITIGIVFIQAGVGKFLNFEKATSFFSQIGIPFPELNVVLAASTEVVGGLCVLLGVCMNLASVPLAFVMIVAILTAHLGDIKGVTDLFGLTAWTYLVIFLVLSGVDSGKYSLDKKCCSKD